MTSTTCVLLTVDRLSSEIAMTKANTLKTPFILSIQSVHDVHILEVHVVDNMDQLMTWTSDRPMASEDNYQCLCKHVHMSSYNVSSSLALRYCSLSPAPFHPSHSK
jgi:hypothetical protein